MCGIFGVVSSAHTDTSEWIRATDTLRRRGPDAGGYFSSEGKLVFLGHRRLSIIDLSQTANQPMRSADGRYVIAYNGEVYNFNELRQKLPGTDWKTGSDTEVILELFAHFGATSFAWLNGIFAFSIYDIAEEKVWICRDHLGVKPLFIRHNERYVCWASELKALAPKNGILAAPAVNRNAIPYFLHLGYIPEPATIYQGIEKFPAGHYGCLDVHTGDWQITPYWRAADYYLTDPVLDEATALKEYQSQLFAAVERQMISDVPLGTFLSGGIDSSLVTAVASRMSPGKVKTFSIGFEDAAFDESEYARQVAAHLQTDHHLFRVRLDDILELIPEFISVYDEPFADSSAFPTMLVSRLARQHVTVALSGDGGDELFQGYGMYTWAGRLNDPKIRLLRKPLHLASRLMNERYQRAGQLFNYPNKQRIPSHIFSQEQYLFSEQELQKLLVRSNFDFTACNNLPEKGSPQEEQAFWDLEHYLKDDLLVKVDRASMHYSLETRVPLLDRELVQYALNLPLSLKIREGYGTKYLMKKVLYDLVPRTIFERPKRGFSIPLNRWLNAELKPLVDHHMSKQKISEVGWVNPDYVSSLLRQYAGGKTYLYNRIWALLVLHMWQDANK